MKIVPQLGLCAAPLSLLIFIMSTCSVSSDAAQALNSSQRQADAAYQSGMKLLREKHYEDALREFQLVQRYAPRLPQGFSGEGIALALMGKPEEAIQALKKA